MTLDSFSFRKSDYYPAASPDEAEEVIGGSILSELLGDTDKFSEMPDDYDFNYYLSRAQFVTEFGDDGPTTVVGVFREGTANERVFTLNNEKHTHENGDPKFTDYPEDWVEVRRA